MRLRTKIVLAVTSMVALLVAGFSYIYISQLLRQKVSDTYEQCKTLAYQLVFDTREAIPDLGSTKIDVNNPKAVRAAMIQFYRPIPTLPTNSRRSWAAGPTSLMRPWWTNKGTRCCTRIRR